MGLAWLHYIHAKNKNKQVVKTPFWKIPTIKEKTLCAAVSNPPVSSTENKVVVVSTNNFIASKENSQSKAFCKMGKNGVDRLDGGRQGF